MGKISVVINTYNSSKNITRAIESVKGLVDEIVVCDMESSDGTVKLAKNLGAKVYTYKNVGYVEPARNFAIDKALGEWILVLDADEEISPKLAKTLKNLTGADFYRIPRKNIIFGKWMQHTLWWPDYQVRFFRKGFVSWGDEIHAFPVTKGKGDNLPEKEELSIIHHNYDFLDQYLDRLFRYTKIQASELLKDGYIFSYKDMISKPFNEFLRRFFSGEGYKDGVHGLMLSLLQSFSELVVYARVWEKQGFKDENISKKDFSKEFEKTRKEFKWWLRKKFSFFSGFF